MDYKELFWTALMWIGALMIIGWAVLKALGVIHSSGWVEMIPYFGGGASVLGVSYAIVYILGKIKKGIEQTEEKVNKIIGIEERFNRLEHEHRFAMNGKLNVKHNS